MLDGQTIQLSKGKYKVIEPLASGGQGAIWKVKSLADNKLYALKTVNRYDSSYHSRLVEISSDNLKKLINYAQAEIDFLLSLDKAEQHHIVSCLDYGLIKLDGYSLPTLVMPLLQNDDLACRIDQFAKKKARLSGKLWLKWFRQLVQALLYMQQANTQGKTPVHRDIKPKNCLLNENDDLFLIDFGIVRASNLTGTSSVVFTYNYCAPEQRLAQYSDGEKQHFYITPAVDIYSTAIVMHEIVAGGIRAQETLNNDNMPTRHLYLLHSQNPQKKDKNKIEKVGWLGKIGGMNEKEKEHLKTELKALFKPKKSSHTVVLNPQKALPNYDAIADKLVELLQKMLSPWPMDRPNASQVLGELKVVEDALEPELTRFEFNKPVYKITQDDTRYSFRSLPNNTANFNQIIFVPFIVEGKGVYLDENDWIEVFINHEIVSDPIFVFIHEIDGKTTIRKGLKLPRPLFNELGKKTITLTTSVNNQQYKTETTIEILPTPEELWQMGEREAALTQKPDVRWLDEWEKEANITSKKYQLLQVLERLQKQYPHNEQLKARIKRVEGIVDEPSENETNERNQEKITKKSKIGSLIIYALGSVFIVIVGIIIWNIILFNESVDTKPRLAARETIQLNTYTKEAAPTTENATPQGGERTPAVATPPVSSAEQPVNTAPETLPIAKPSIDINKIKTAFESGTEEEQKQAWQELINYKKENPQASNIEKLKKVENQYQGVITKWLTSSNTKKQKQAFQRLKVITAVEKDAKNAYHLLGQAYMYGMGTKKDYGKAKTALETAIANGHVKAKDTLKSLLKKQ